MMAAMRLVGVHVASQSDHLEVTWTTEGEVPGQGSVLWSLFLTSEGGGPRRQLGYKLVDDQPSAQFVFDFGPAKQENFPVDVDLTAEALVARYPLSVLDGLGEGWTWRATLSLDGLDVSEIS